MIEINSVDNLEKLAHAYFFAKQIVLKNGYEEEIDWQDNVSFSSITSKVFLKESAWVILAAGLNDNVVSKKFNELSDVFFSWDPTQIVNNMECEKKALLLFNNKLKIRAIISVANIIVDVGINEIKNNIVTKGVDYLEEFPFIGPVTKYHLAKNIGLLYSKPDRHLVRISDLLGYNSPRILCEAISKLTSEKISVVDLVIWRYATIQKGYLRQLNHYVNRFN